MGFHLVTSTRFDFDMFVRRAQEDQGPRHTIHQIAQYLNAEIHQPEENSVTLADRLLSKVFGQPAQWTLARKLSSQLTANDVVYCAGEDVGLPLAILCKFKLDRPQVATYIMAPDRLRSRILMKKFGLADQIRLFTVNDKYKSAYLEKTLDLSDVSVFVLPEQTDANFFTPGLGSLNSTLPLITSAGLEQRDYLTLAEATQNKPVNVKICAFSPNASSKTRTRMPEEIPPNMEIRHYEFSELRDLYRSADIVVISLLENKYSAGLTVLMEAMACNRPVIITSNIGLSNEIISKDLVLGVEPEDVAGLWKAINYLLNNPQEAKDMAQRAYEYFLAHHTSDYYVSELSQRLEVLQNNLELSDHHS